ncbi:Nmad5 family putative nucleotide modification protein [Undibacterium sp. 5I1]|uniref:Nmad5 family putative nucleotide modification protein n=1 Tax=unclassified Undibacterium TaxID=2630295 RepID=UPI002AB3ACFA|nr:MULTISPECIES: Nmad5 family putative nucleotide modification protein [unclassified Undibacterium]MDY7537557.1 Nmad5 family putative nucleotide modification protein [Undibacterium sp. 5I1]MEB0231942.1 Nmad5 family putative nucleotide modification protein [Undibacterium sp. 10I3]MEB0256293.1 Nmad5 family putative nucleotide modification protein [Undibacterium sp. 5I1]
MSSKRITKELFATIVSNAIKGAYQSEFDEITKRQKEITLKVYRLLVTEEQEKAMKKLPHGFFNVTSGRQGIYVSAGRGDDARRTKFSAHFGDGCRMPANSSGFNSINVTSDEIYKEFEQLKQDESEVRSKVALLEEKVKAIVGSVFTVKKLILVWPEGKVFIPEEALVDRSENLPALIVDGLNNLLMSARPGLELTAP